ncbi:GW dipeptide domain-containing protein [Listeria welshimeri]|uniref:GW dipeptide domain-containing protein n=1 Tax=Listeria welshimeri TaxID=1643 RepID=UPI001887384D|nr:GW dipeptide domain-containing protein [Listeria welshimeri]MBF2342591.1 SH3-like domain-containing protein [Listeria welshimeri]
MKKLLLFVLLVAMVFVLMRDEAYASEKRVTEIHAEGVLVYAYDITKNPTGTKNNKKVRGTKKDYGKKYKLREVVKIGSRNSYKVYLNGKYQGYIDARAMSKVKGVNEITEVLLSSFKTKSKSVYCEGTLVSAYNIYKNPIGTKNNKKIRGTKKDYGKKYKVRSIVNNNNNTSYKVYLNGKYQGYIDHRALNNMKLVNYSSENIYAYGDYKDKKKGKESFRIEKETSDDLGGKYQVKFNNNTRKTVPKSEINMFYKSTMEKKCTGLKKIKNINTNFYASPVNNETLKKNTTKQYQNRYLNVNAKIKVKNEVWYRVWLNEHDGKKWTNPTLGWLKESDLKNVNDTTKNYKLTFNISEKTNQQGLTYNDGIYYVAFDLSKAGYPNHSKIIAYDQSGREIGETTPLAIGHGAELCYYKGKIYATNGGGNDGAQIFIVDFENNRVDDVIDLSSYGTCALATIKDDDTIILHTSENSNKVHTFSYVDFKGNLKKQFTIENAWVPQGLDYYNNKIYFYTNNLVTQISDDGAVTNQEYLNLKGESEGIALNKETGKVIIGYNSNNRIYEQK